MRDDDGFDQECSSGGGRRRALCTPVLNIEPVGFAGDQIWALREETRMISRILVYGPNQIALLFTVRDGFVGGKSGVQVQAHWGCLSRNGK